MKEEDKISVLCVKKNRHFVL